MVLPQVWTFLCPQEVWSRSHRQGDVLVTGTIGSIPGPVTKQTWLTLGSAPHLAVAHTATQATRAPWRPKFRGERGLARAWHQLTPVVESR